MLERGTFSWATYLIHRLMRLWVVLLPGLLLCALWDALAIHFRLAPALYAGANYNHMIPDIRAVHTLKIFLQNLFFLQTLHGTPVFGSDRALWSLANEFWYYLLFPLGLLTLHRTSTPTTRLRCGALFLLIALSVGPNILFTFPIWLLGTLLALLPTPNFSQTTRIAAAIIYTPVFFLTNKLIPASHPTLQNWLLSLATCIFLWILLSATSEAKPSPTVRFSRKISRFSYTLYVAHMPFALILTALVVGDTRWLPTTSHILTALAILALILAYAYLLATLTEFHTNQWRRRLESKLHVH